MQKVCSLFSGRDLAWQVKRKGIIIVVVVVVVVR